MYIGISFWVQHQRMISDLLHGCIINQGDGEGIPLPRALSKVWPNFHKDDKLHLDRPCTWDDCSRFCWLYYLQSHLAQTPWPSPPPSSSLFLLESQMLAISSKHPYPGQIWTSLNLYFFARRKEERWRVIEILLLLWLQCCNHLGHLWTWLLPQIFHSGSSLKVP